MLTSLGFQVHPTKRVPPTQCIEFTGLVFNSIEGTISLPQRKIDKSEALIKELLACDLTKVPLPLLDSLVGILSHLTFVITHGRAALVPLYRDIAKACPAMAHRAVRKRIHVRLREASLGGLRW